MSSIGWARAFGLACFKQTLLRADFLWLGLVVIYILFLGAHAPMSSLSHGVGQILESFRNVVREGEL